MAETHLRRRVMHSPEDLLNFVSDVQGYPEFINLISAVRMSKQQTPEPGVETFEAAATVSYKFFRESFHSHVTVDRNSNRIDVGKATRGGAVKTLKNRWIFHELSDGSSLVDFYVNVTLKAFPLEMLVRDKFGKASEHIMSLFFTRAGQICPKTGDPDLDVEAELSRLSLGGIA